MSVHFARDAGRGWNAGVLANAEAVKAGRSGCAGARACLKRTAGRTRRRRSWTGIVAVN